MKITADKVFNDLTDIVHKPETLALTEELGIVLYKKNNLVGTIALIRMLAGITAFIHPEEKAAVLQGIIRTLKHVAAEVDKALLEVTAGGTPH